MNAPAGNGAYSPLEWLSTNRLGSFSLGRGDRRVRRKYHPLFSVREPGRGDAWNVLAEVVEQIDYEGTSSELCDPLRGEARPAELVSFSYAPHPTHVYRVAGVEVERTLRLSRDADQVELTYRVRGVRSP